MTFEELTDKAIEYFQENETEFIWAIEGLDSNRGYLDDARIEDMYVINDIYYEWTVAEIIKLALDGDDEDGSTFDPDKDYFYRSSWDGHLTSTNTRDYSYFLDADFIECLFNEYKRQLGYGWSIDDYDYPQPIQELFNAYIEEHGE